MIGISTAFISSLAIGTSFIKLSTDGWWLAKLWVYLISRGTVW